MQKYLVVLKSGVSFKINAEELIEKPIPSTFHPFKGKDAAEDKKIFLKLEETAAIIPESNFINFVKN